VTFFQDDGVRRIEERAARVGTRQILAALHEVFIRGRGEVTVELLLLG
jgi:hypothetical protein